MGLSADNTGKYIRNGFNTSPNTDNKKLPRVLNYKPKKSLYITSCWYWAFEFW